MGYRMGSDAYEDTARLFDFPHAAVPDEAETR